MVSYSKLYSRSFSYSLSFFLEQLEALPPFHKLGALTEKLGRDCSKWVELFQNETSSLVQNTKNIDEVEYMSTFLQLNPTKELEVTGSFAEKHSTLLQTACRNQFVDNPYHRILFELLYSQTCRVREGGRSPHLICEVPTGCGKSWVLAILAAALKEELHCNVLVATSNNFLAKFAEETYGMHFGLTYNRSEDSYVSFPKLTEVLQTLQEPTFVLIDEVDSFLFENPLATKKNGGCKSDSVVLKAQLLRQSNVLGVVGLTGTFDHNYGAQSLRRLFSDPWLLKAPTMLNQEVSSNLKAGMKPGSYYSDRQFHLNSLFHAVVEHASTRPVIVVVQDEEQLQLVEETLTAPEVGDLKKFNTLSKIGEIAGNDKFYLATRQRMRELKKLERVVLLITKEESRGIDFQFKPGSPPAHVVIAYEVLSPSELRQAVGRSCRQLGHKCPSWQCIIQDKDEALSDEVILDMAEGKDANQSLLSSQQWRAMALSITRTAEVLPKHLRAEKMPLLQDVAEEVNSNLY